jgi:Flp pilus assembly protein TadG
MVRLRSMFRALGDRKAASTAEFALVAPAALMMMIGGMYIAMLGFTAASLRYATEQGARCASVNSTLCGTAANAEAYALSQFKNLSGSTATFTATSESCGQKIAGSISYSMKLATYQLSVPLTASACFP